MDSTLSIKTRSPVASPTRPSSTFVPRCQRRGPRSGPLARGRSPPVPAHRPARTIPYHARSHPAPTRGILEGVVYDLASQVPVHESPPTWPGSSAPSCSSVCWAGRASRPPRPHPPRPSPCTAPPRGRYTSPGPPSPRPRPPTTSSMPPPIPPCSSRRPPHPQIP